MASPSPESGPGSGPTLAPESPAPANSPSPSPDPAYRPVFEPAPCVFPIPPGTDPQCGYLVLPEDRARPQGNQVRLHTAIFSSSSPDPDPYPVIHLAGGPGSSSLEVARYLFAVGLDEVLESHDLILFDQRGTGYSEPHLGCPERERLAQALLDGDLSEQQAGEAVVESFRQCRERLSAQGIDLSAYNSAASAADLDDLRRALGYEQLNLYGVSYGTRLALTLLRDYPQAVRSAVLDSTYPPEVDLYASLAPNAQRAFDAFFASCAANAACDRSFPDLETVFYAQVDRLNQEPVQVSLIAAGEQHSALVTGELLIDVLFVGLYNPLVTAGMPAMIYELQRGETAILEQRLALYFEDAPAIGMQMAVQCAEEFSFSSPERPYELAGEVRPALAAFFPDSLQPLYAVCQDWALPPARPYENEPVVTDRPLLILAGELDPITPPAWGRQVAESNTNARYYEFSGLGHWVTRSPSDALPLALEFWRSQR